MVRGGKRLASEWDQDKVANTLDHINRRQRIELDTCARCGLCTDSCPTYSVSGNANYSPSVRASKMAKILNKRVGLLTMFTGKKPIGKEEMIDLADSVYNCTLCGRCGETCPFGFQTHELWASLRNVEHSVGGQSVNISHLERQLSDTRNPYGLDPETRLDWVDYSGLEGLPKKEKAKLVYFVGCTTAFKGADQGVAYSLATILSSLKEDWTVLGEEEWCCGSPKYIAGDEKGVNEYALHNIEAIEKIGAETVVTSCSGCYRMLKWEYPKIIGRKPCFEVKHAVTYLRDSMISGKLKARKLDERVTYHDPCELARLGGVVEAPREILACLADDFVEIQDNKLDSRCCGGGGLLQSTNNDLRMKVVKRRLEQVVETGAEILTSSCPSCKLTFLDGVREFGYKLEVMDLVELVERQMKT